MFDIEVSVAKCLHHVVVIDPVRHRDAVVVVDPDLAVAHADVVAVADEAVDVMTVAEHFTINQLTRNMVLQPKPNTLLKLIICLQDAVGKI